MKARPKKSTSFACRSLVLAGSIAMLVMPRSAPAATRTWSGAAADGLWATPANWGGTTPVTGDTALFNTTDTAISLAGAAQGLTSFTFDTSVGSFTFNTGGAGGQFNLASGGNITLASTATGANLLETFNAPLSLGGSYAFTNSRLDAGSALVFAGNITNTAASTLTLSGAGTGTGNLISGNISDGGGTQSVTESATAGKWTLSGANSYSGVTTLSGAGTLVLSGSNSSAGATTLSSGILQLNNTTANNGGLAGGLLSVGNATVQSLVSNLAISNNVTITGTANISGANSLTINGNLTNSGGNRLLNSSITGGNTLTLAGNIYLSESNVIGRTFTIGGTAATLLSGVIADSNGGGAAGTLTITDTGITTLSGANTYSGGTNINAGTLSVATIGLVGGASSNLGAAGVLNIGSGATNGKLLYTGVGETTDRVVNLAGTTGNATIDQSGTGLLKFTSALTAGGIGAKSLTLQGSTTGIGEIAGAIVDSQSGTNNTGVTKSGTGTWTLSGANTYTGVTAISGGTLVVTSTNGLGNSTASNAVSLSSTARLSLLNNGAGSNGTIVYTGTGSASGYNVTATNTPTINVGGSSGTNTGNTVQLGTLVLTNPTLTITNSNGYNLSFSGAGTTTANGFLTNNMTGGTTTLASLTELDAASRTFTFNGISTSAVTNVGAIGQNGASALNVSQSGVGELILSGANTYTGTTIANGGTLLLDMNAGGSINGATGTALTLGGGNFQVKGASGGSSQNMGALTLTASTNNVITLDPNNGAGVTLTLGNAWTRNAGSSLLFDYSSANTGARSVVTAGATTSATLTNGIYGWALVKDSAGVVGFATRAAGTNTAITRYDDTTGTTLATNSNSITTNFTTLGSTYTGGNGGTLTWTNGGALNSRSVNSLTIDTSNNFGVIDLGATTNILAITSLGLLFKGPNDETVTGGKIGASGTEVIVHETGSGTLTINSLISAAAGSLTKDGTGALAVGAANVYTGATNVNAGTLIVSGSLNGTASVNVASGAALASGASGSITTAAAGNVGIAGSLAPGGSAAGTDAGTLNLSLGTGGKLNFAPASSLLFGLGTTSDLVAFSTAGNWLGGSGNATLNLDVTLAGFSYANTYTIFQNATTSGFTFANITGYDTADWTANFFQSGNNYELNFVAVPEPSTALLLIGGLGVLPLWRRRRSARPRP